MRATRPSALLLVLAAALALGGRASRAQEASDEDAPTKQAPFVAPVIPPVIPPAIAPVIPPAIAPVRRPTAPPPLVPRAQVAPPPTDGSARSWPLLQGYDPRHPTPPPLLSPELYERLLQQDRERRRRSLFLVGLSLFGTSYLASVVFGGYFGGNPAYYIPVAGPLILGIANGSADAVVLGFAVTSVQLTGALVLGFGGWRLTHPPAALQRITLMPIVSPSLTGLAVGGSF